jgi:predicted nucleic acid-binding protein
MLVLDTSVIFNLLGSGRPKLLLRHIPYQVFAPKQVVLEIKREPEIQIDKDAELVDLIKGGLITVAEANGDADTLALALAGAPSPNDLDDGESYAIAYAVVLGAAIGIDERKGRRIISEQWPKLNCRFSLELIESAVSAAQLTADEGSAFIFSALRHARMRVPAERRADLIALVGKNRARMCSSLGYVPD